MTEWFWKRPGSDIQQSQEDPGMLLISQDDFDWINVPVAGVGERKFLGVKLGPCVAQGHNHEAKHYMVEGGFVACECLQDKKYIWYTMKEK